MFESLSLTRKLGLAFAALFASLAVAGPASAQEAAENPNNQTCVGSITKGEAPADDPTLGTVDYQVGCSGKITGYILVSSHAIVEFETEVFGVDFAKREVVGSDFFSCSGDIPGFGINCVGSTSWGWRLMNGKFNIEGDVCEEPRPNVLLYATTATVASGKVSQAITGPWNLGRPRGCPKSANGGKTLIPDDPEPSSRMTIASAVKKAQAKTKAAKKAKKSAKKAAKKTARKSARNARAKR